MPEAHAVSTFVERFAAAVDAHAQELTELDSAIGDADHGINLQRGMRAAVERLPAGGATPDAILRAVANALISKTGGASGPLYGTAFLRASQAVAGCDSLDAGDVARMFRAALDGIRERGKAEPGDKTMVDAFTPAVDALEAGLARGDDLGTALRAAARAASAGSDATIPLVARKGRASYLGERSREHRDPGSRSTTLLFEAAAEALPA
jgi:dihydroxyacetone kinase-like protein